MPGIKDIDDTKAPLLDHLIELRTRLIRSAIAWVVLFFVCFYFSKPIYIFLTRPLQAAFDAVGRQSARLIITAPQEAFFTYIKLSALTSLFIAFPIIAAQIWMFVAPGLYKTEKKAFLPFLMFTPILFFAGGAVVYYLMMPVALKFFILFTESDLMGGLASASDGLPIQLEARVSEYLSFVVALIFAFGISFELPLILSLLGRVGLVTSEGLAEKRKYSIVIAFIAAAVLTPPDPLSQISLAVPIILLYEISIWSVKFIERGRAEREAAQDAEIFGSGGEAAAGASAGGSTATTSVTPAVDPVEETDFNHNR